MGNFPQLITWIEYIFWALNILISPRAEQRCSQEYSNIIWGSRWSSGVRLKADIDIAKERSWVSARRTRNCFFRHCVQSLNYMWICTLVLNKIAGHVASIYNVLEIHMAIVHWFPTCGSYNCPNCDYETTNLIRRGRYTNDSSYIVASVTLFRLLQRHCHC